MLRFEIYGALFIIALGTLLHFTYAAADELWWVGIFSAMNESVWEHLKLSFWPGAFWTFFLWLNLTSKPSNFWAGRAASLTLTPILIVVGFYGYTAVIGGHLLIMDLALFVFSVAGGQAAAVAVYRARKFSSAVEAASFCLILLLLAAFATLSFHSPRWPLFADPTHAN